MKREPHALTLESTNVVFEQYLKGARDEMMYRAACSCGQWSVTPDRTAKVCRAMHAEHLQAVLGSDRRNR